MNSPKKRRYRKSYILTKRGQKKLKDALSNFLHQKKCDDIYNQEQDKFNLSGLAKLLQTRCRKCKDLPCPRSQNKKSNSDCVQYSISSGTLDNILNCKAASDCVEDIFDQFNLKLELDDIQEKNIDINSDKPDYCPNRGNYKTCSFCAPFFTRVKDLILSDRLECGAWSAKFNYSGSEHCYAGYTQKENFFCTYQVIRALHGFGHDITAKSIIGKGVIEFLKNHQRKAGGIGYKVSGRGGALTIFPSPRRTAYAVMILAMVDGGLDILEKGLAFLGRSVFEDLEEDDGAASMAITAFLLAYPQIINSNLKDTLFNDDRERYKQVWNEKLYVSANKKLRKDAEEDNYEFWEPFAKSAYLETATNLATVDLLLEVLKYPEICKPPYPIEKIVSTLEFVSQGKGNLNGYTALLSTDKQMLDVGTSSYFAYLSSNNLIFQGDEPRVEQITKLGDQCFKFVVDATMDENWKELNFLTEMLAPVLLLKGCPWRTRWQNASLKLQS